LILPRRARLPLKALTLSLAVAASAACSPFDLEESNRDGYEIANRVVAADIAAGGTAVSDLEVPVSLALASDDGDQASADCELEVTTDEYGFEETKLRCADGHTLGPSVVAASAGVRPDPSASAARVAPAALLAGDDPLPLDTYGVLIVDHLGPGAVSGELVARELSKDLLALSSRLDRLDATCGVDPKEWRAALADYQEAAQSALEAATPDRFGDFAGSVEANVLAKALVERVLFQSGCRRPEPELLSPGGDVDVDDLVRLTRDVATVTVSLNNALRASTYGPLFHTYSTLPNYLWMRSERTPVEVVMLGTSQAGAALNVKAMNENLDAEIGSAWIPGALAEVQALWVDEITSRTAVRTFVWFVGPLDLFAECDTSKRGVEFKKLADARAATFSQGFVVSPDPLDRILGWAEPADTVRGDGIKREGFDADGTASHRKQYVPAFEKGLFCHERAEIISETIGRLNDEGHEVVIVGMPVHPELRAVRTDQAEKMTLFRQRYLRSTTFLDLTETMVDPESWSDFTHLTGQGADDFTAIAIERLREEGL